MSTKRSGKVAHSGPAVASKQPFARYLALQNPGVAPSEIRPGSAIWERRREA